MQTAHKSAGVSRLQIMGDKDWGLSRSAAPRHSRQSALVLSRLRALCRRSKTAPTYTQDREG